jgi:hypothetical protein
LHIGFGQLFDVLKLIQEQDLDVRGSSGGKVTTIEPFEAR